MADVLSSVEFDVLSNKLGDVARELDESTAKLIVEAIGPVNRGIDDLKQRLVGLLRQRQGDGKPPKAHPADTLLRSITARVIAAAMGQDAEAVAKHMFGESSPAQVAVRDLTAFWRKAVERAVAPPAMTTIPTWAAELFGSAVALDLVASLAPSSLYSRLSARGLKLNLSSGTVSIPRPSSTPTPDGPFVGESSPIPIKALSFAAVTAKPFSAKVISLYSREIARSSAAASLIQRGISEDLQTEIDAVLVDANPQTAIRPAGLLFGVTPTAPGAGGGSTLDDLAASFSALIGALSGPVIDPVLLANTIDAVPMQMVAPAIADRILASPAVPVGTVIAVDAGAFFSGSGDSPIIDVDEQGLVHESDDPLPIATGAAGAGVLATPTRSLWQTATIGVRIVNDVSWGLTRPGAVASMVLP